MSNNIKDSEISIFQFLGSQDFIKELVNTDLPPEEHNLLLSAHLLAIGFNTSGITEGSVKVKYERRVYPINENFCRPVSNFAFYTTKNGLIESSNYFNRQSIKFNHPLFYFTDTRGFRDFCIEYFEKHQKIVDSEYLVTQTTDLDTSINFRLSGRKRKSEEGQLYGYNSIICGNPNVKSSLDAWLLRKELTINTHIKQKRIKL